MRPKLLLLIGIFTFTFPLQGMRKTTGDAPLKPRIIVLTDVSTWETDDSESLVRLLVHADMLEIEGLVFTTGYSLEQTRDDFFDLIHLAIDAYEKDLPNLMKRSGQTGFLEDESEQHIGYWPSADYLRERTVYGSKNRGMEFIGADNGSDGSALIIAQADEEDERPVWVTVWGGGNTLAQAIWDVQQTRSATELTAFLHKLRTYTITDQDAPNIFAIPAQDRERRKPEILAQSAHQWMRREFQDDLLFIWDECAWLFQNGTGKGNWDAYATHIQGHGNLGAVYPKYKYGVEGDTPSFLYLLPIGLSNPEVPEQAGWGGYFEWGPGPDKVTNAYNNHTGSAYDISRNYSTYFYPATFNNFAARMDWAAEGMGNRNPVVILNKDRGIEAIMMEPKPGKTIRLDASKTFDPDGDALNFKWWILPEAGTYSGDVPITNPETSEAKILVPEGSAGKTIHVICEVTDNGEHPLTSYSRIILSPRE